MAFVLVCLFTSGLSLLAWLLTPFDFRQHLKWMDLGIALSGSSAAVVLARSCNGWTFLVAGLFQRPIAVISNDLLREAIWSQEFSWSLTVKNILAPGAMPLVLGLLTLACGAGTWWALGGPARRVFETPPIRSWFIPLGRGIEKFKEVVELGNFLYGVAAFLLTVIAAAAAFKGCR